MFLVSILPNKLIRKHFYLIKTFIKILYFEFLKFPFLHFLKYSIFEPFPHNPTSKMILNLNGSSLPFHLILSFLFLFKVSLDLQLPKIIVIQSLLMTSFYFCQSQIPCI